MTYNRSASAAIAIILLTSSVARAGFDAGVLITKSPQLEKEVSHVLAGRLKAVHEIKAIPGRDVAELAVTVVEKGTGVVPGDLIYVRFTSPRTLAQIEAERIIPDCGDRKIDPLPGEWARVYTSLNDGFEYVADYPSCFYFIGRKEPAEIAKGVADSVTPFTASAIAIAFLAGIVAGFSLRSRRSAIRSGTLLGDSTNQTGRGEFEGT